MLLSGVSRLACRRIIRFVYDVIASEEEFARMWVVEPVFIYTESITVSHEYGLDCMVINSLSFVCLSGYRQMMRFQIFLDDLHGVCYMCKIVGCKICVEDSPL